jgi:hypothetical protein
MSRASKPDKQNGTLSVHTIKASGHVHRSNRPNTRLHPTTTPNHQINPCNAGAIHTGHSQPPFYLSRWGRFRDADEISNYEYICKRVGISVLSALAFDQGFA